MNSSLVIFATVACAALGWWMPSLWLEPPHRTVRRIVPRPSEAAQPSWQDLQSQVRGASSAMEQFHAIAAGVRGRGASLARHAAGIGDLHCDEAEELAQQLAGEELGSRIRDGAAFIDTLRKCSDYEVRCAALEAWAAAEPDAALELLLKQRNQTPSGAEGVIKRLAARDPDKALSILKSGGKGYGLRDLWRPVLAACAEESTELAVQAIRSAPHDARYDGMALLLRRLAAKDPRAAIAWWAGLPADLKAFGDQDVIFEEWAHHDPQAALDEWLATPPSGADGSLNAALTWARNDAEGLLRWATAQTAGPEVTNCLVAAVDAMAEHDPQRAMAMLEYVPAERRRDSLWIIGRSLVQRDPRAALAWVRSLPEDGDRPYILNGLAPSLRPLPEAERRAFAQEIGADTPAGFRIMWDVDRAEAVSTFRAMTTDQQVAAYSSISANTFREPCAEDAMLVESIVRSNSEAAGRKADAQAAYTLSRYVAELTSGWAARDPVAAAAWVGQLPPGDSQATAAANVTLTWARYDLLAAREWAETLPAGPVRETAEKELAGIAAVSGGD